MGHGPPDAALSVLYGYVARLRKALAPAGVRPARHSGGYLLDIDPDSVDAHRFRRLLAEADTADNPERAAAFSDEALALWRGTPFPDISGAWIAKIRQVLEEQRLSAVIARNEARLRTGRHGELVSELLELLVTHPVDERLVGQLMRALCRSGRPSEALEQSRLARRRLRDRQGTDPGPLLRGMHQRILRAGHPGDPGLRVGGSRPGP